MKKLCSVIIGMAGIVLLSCTSVQAQSKGPISIGEFKAAATLGSKKPIMGSWGVVFNNGYNFNRTLSAELPFEMALGLFRSADKVQTYQMNALLGLNLGVNLCHHPDWAFQFVGGAGSSLINNSRDTDWTFMYYDAGIRWHQNFDKGWQPYFLYGVRYYNSYTTRYDSRLTMCVGFGFRFNAR